MTTTTQQISGDYVVSPEGCDDYAVTIRDGRLVSLLERCLVPTGWTGTEIPQADQTAVLAIIGEWLGERLDAAQYVVGRID
jgi:hypothetical protein